MASSIAQNYFDKFTGPNALEILEGLPTQNPIQFEDNWLDFKVGEPDRLEHRWSEAIGAFANTGGGVVIFGIDCSKKGEPPIDAPNSVKYVPNVDALASRLLELSRNATDPPVEGIQVKPIPKAEGESAGFVVCLIPEGKVKPYQSIQAQRRFYMRFTDSIQEAPLPVLRQLFYPVYKREMQLTLTHDNLSIGEANAFLIKADLLNLGETTIEKLNIRFQSFDTESVKVYFDGKEMHGQFNVHNGDYLHPQEGLKFEIAILPVKNRFNDSAFALYFTQLHCTRLAFVFHQDRFGGSFADRDNQLTNKLQTVLSTTPVA